MPPVVSELNRAAQTGAPYFPVQMSFFLLFDASDVDKKRRCYETWHILSALRLCGAFSSDMFCTFVSDCVKLTRDVEVIYIPTVIRVFPPKLPSRLKDIVAHLNSGKVVATSDPVFT